MKGGGKCSINLGVENKINKVSRAELILFYQ